MKILLVEDEVELSGYIEKGLKYSGYAVDTAYDGEDALYKISVNNYDLVVLDLNLPKKSGLEVLKEIRKTDGEVKILILSARSQVNDRILGLDEGANDYLVKPFDFGELEARIRNLLRREFSQSPSILLFGDLSLDTAAKRLCFKENEITLTRKEYNILEYLMLHKGQTISTEELMEHIWDSEFNPFSNVLRYHIHSLKKKLSIATGKDYIKTLRGQGYRLEDL